MTGPSALETLSWDAATRTERNQELLQAFYDIATKAYLNNWGQSFHLPPFTAGQGVHEACTAQERAIAGHFEPGQHVLDLGCGVGGPARTIASAVPGLRITGVNIVREQLEIAAGLTRQDGLTYRHADFTCLPFDDGTFDGAYTFDALCHSPNKPVAYQEVHRVLRPGTTFVGTDWMHTDGLSPAEYARWIEPVCHYAALPDLLSPQTVATRLTEAGFTVHRCHDLAESSDLSPNWDLFDDIATTVANHPDPAHQFMYEHCVTTAAAGRAGSFTIGMWEATACEKGRTEP